MDGLREYHTEWSKSEKKISNGIPYMWILKKKKKNDTNELTKQKEAHRLKEQIYGCPGGRTGEMDS